MPPLLAGERSGGCETERSYEGKANQRSLYVKHHFSPPRGPRPRRHPSEPSGAGHTPHPAGHRGGSRPRHRGPARHRAAAVQSSAGRGPADRRPLRHHLQRCRRLGPGHRPHERRLQPLLQCCRTPHHRAGLPHRAAHAGGAGAGGLCTLYGIPRRDERLLRWPHLP